MWPLLTVVWGISYTSERKGFFSFWRLEFSWDLYNQKGGVRIQPLFFSFLLLGTYCIGNLYGSIGDVETSTGVTGILMFFIIVLSTLLEMSSVFLHAQLQGDGSRGWKGTLLELGGHSLNSHLKLTSKFLVSLPLQF